MGQLGLSLSPTPSRFGRPRIRRSKRLSRQGEPWHNGFVESFHNRMRVLNSSRTTVSSISSMPAYSWPSGHGATMTSSALRTRLPQPAEVCGTMETRKHGPRLNQLEPGLQVIPPARNGLPMPGEQVAIRRCVQSRKKARPKGSSPTKVMTQEDRLRREVEKLRENAYLKKITGIRPATRLKVEVIVTSHHRLNLTCLLRQVLHAQRFLSSTTPHRS